MTNYQLILYKQEEKALLEVLQQLKANHSVVDDTIGITIAYTVNRFTYTETLSRYFLVSAFVS